MKMPALVAAARRLTLRDAKARVMHAAAARRRLKSTPGSRPSGKLPLSNMHCLERTHSLTRLAVWNRLVGAATAVLVALLDEPGRLPLALLLTRRSMLVGSHRGQVAFAGGRCEPGESAEEAALREAEEELGIEPGNVDVWGALHDCHSYYGDVVTPVVASVRVPHALHSASVDPVVEFDARHAPFAVAEAEVAGVLRVPLWRLVDRRWVSFDQLGYRAVVPRFAGHAPHDIWGLSSVFVRDLLVALDLWRLPTPPDGGRIVTRG